MLDYFMYSYIIGMIGILIFFLILIFRYIKNKVLIDVKAMVILIVSLICFGVGLGMGIAAKYNLAAPTYSIKPEQNAVSFYAVSNSNLAKTTEEVAKNKSAVILIKCDEALGSGFIINNSGYVITNHHVIENSNSFIGVFQNQSGEIGEKLPMDLIAFDGDSDIALLKLRSEKNYNYLYFGDSDKASEGEKVVAIGSPKGMINTVSEGIISGIRNTGEIKYIQISAPISPGSSGGALFNSKGELIGMPTFKLRNGENLNFAISSKDIIKFLDGSKTIECIKNYNENKGSTKTKEEKIFDKEHINYDYINPYSSTRQLQYDEIKNLNIYLLGLARNEIYARHGYIFTVSEYRNYFNSKSWYKPNANFKEADLTDIERYNAVLMLKREQQLKGE